MMMPPRLLVRCKCTRVTLAFLLYPLDCDRDDVILRSPTLCDTAYDLGSDETGKVMQKNPGILILIGG